MHEDHSTEPSYVHTNMEGVDSDECRLCSIRKHWFGVFGLYFSTLFAVVMTAGLAFFLLPQLLGDERGRLIATAAVVVVTVIAVVIVVTASILYQQNRLQVTDKNLTQILQKGLFNRKVSQLTMANVEDVTADVRGIFATIFNYGSLNIETAGEQMNFKFEYCPKPRYYAKIILEAREKYIQHYKKPE
jgi:uncharacterized membrane protein YdbT with pleckstrin-like domain